MKALHDQVPDGPLLAWYGDDFTGASAVLEVLAFAGIPSMLFLEPPTKEQLAHYPDLSAIGVASTARAQTPDWMDEELPAIFEQLKSLNPALLHYKICSTLDSSPAIGSIGRAIEVGHNLFSPSVVPLLVAAPQMRRYQVFGHLFASSGDDVYRLDRHPVMSRHPVTPMDESDVAKHIVKQSERLDATYLSLEALALQPSSYPSSPATTDDRISLMTLDCVDGASESAAGHLMWNDRHANPFVVGSQGVEFALVRYWQDNGFIPTIEAPTGIGRAERLVVVSGSVSPTTAGQIAWSKANGFAAIAFDATAVCGGSETLDYEIERTINAALAAIDLNQDPLIHTAEGPDDPAVKVFKNALSNSSLDLATANQMIGESLGRILNQVLIHSGARRAVVSGGDTSGYATRQLGVFALTALAPTIPGASISKAHADGQMDGLELALKGGQMGSEDYFGWVRSGGGSR